MTAPLPPIYRDCRRLLVHTEEAVRRFSRYHKYTVGTDLRQAAMQIMRAVNMAVHDKAQQSQHVQRLVWLSDDYKLTLQLAADIGAFTHSTRGAQAKPSPSFHAFEQAATLASQIGKQCGGWQQALARRQRSQQVGPGAACGGESPHTSARAAGSKPHPPGAAHPASLSERAAPGGPIAPEATP